MYMPAEPLIVEIGPSDGEKWSRQGSQIDGLDLAVGVSAWQAASITTSHMGISGSQK